MPMYGQPPMRPMRPLPSQATAGSESMPTGRTWSVPPAFANGAPNSHVPFAAPPPFGGVMPDGSPFPHDRTAMMPGMRPDMPTMPMRPTFGRGRGMRPRVLSDLIGY